jgi:hypothetical protein
MFLFLVPFRRYYSVVLQPFRSQLLPQPLIDDGIAPQALGHFGFTQSAGVTQIISHGTARKVIVTVLI